MKGSSKCRWRELRQVCKKKNEWVVEIIRRVLEGCGGVNHKYPAPPGSTLKLIATSEDDNPEPLARERQMLCKLPDHVFSIQSNRRLWGAKQQKLEGEMSFSGKRFGLRGLLNRA